MRKWRHCLCDACPQIQIGIPSVRATCDKVNKSLFLKKCTHPELGSRSSTSHPWTGNRPQQNITQALFTSFTHQEFLIWKLIFWHIFRIFQISKEENIFKKKTEQLWAMWTQRQLFLILKILDFYPCITKGSKDSK